MRRRLAIVALAVTALVAVAFAVPLAWFWFRGAIPRGFKPRQLALLALGGLQGVFGRGRGVGHGYEFSGRAGRRTGRHRRSFVTGPPWGRAGDPMVRSHSP